MAGHRFRGERVMRSALSTSVDHDNTVLTSQGDYLPIKRRGAGIGKLRSRARAALPQSFSMSLVVAIQSPQPK
jgi:hypothetical protein